MCSANTIPCPSGDPPSPVTTSSRSLKIYNNIYHRATSNQEEQFPTLWALLVDVILHLMNFLKYRLVRVHGQLLQDHLHNTLKLYPQDHFLHLP